MEDDATRPEPVGDAIDPAAELQRLREQMKRLEEQISARPAPEQPQTESLVVPNEPEPEKIASKEDVAEAENLIRQSRVAKMRNQSSIAREMLRHAQELAPDVPAVLEAVGDDLMERGRNAEAKEIFKRAFETDKTNVNIERKLAMAAMNSGGMNAFDVESMMRGETSVPDDSWASAKAAMWLNVFLPGTGQIVTGSKGKGLTILVGWAIAWAIALMIPNGVNGLFSLVGAKTQGSPQLNIAVFPPLIVGLILHLWSLYDMAHLAERQKMAAIRKVHPKPPVDLPF